jgi:hypothetical protein
MVLRRKAGHFKNIMVLMGLMATVALGCVTYLMRTTRYLQISPRRPVSLSLSLYLAPSPSACWLAVCSCSCGWEGFFRVGYLTACVDSCSTFALEPSDFASRSQVVLSLLLNAVAYKFAVAAELPHVPYSTTFDEYMDASVKFLLLLFIENALVGWPTRYLEGAAGAQTFVDHVLSVAIAVRYTPACTHAPLRG